MRKLIATALLILAAATPASAGWTFCTLGYQPEGERFIPAPAQFTFATMQDCLAAHLGFQSVGFVTAPHNGESVGCWDGSPPERVGFPRD